jgi:hypothetical protein
MKSLTLVRDRIANPEGELPTLGGIRGLVLALACNPRQEPLRIDLVPPGTAMPPPATWSRGQHPGDRTLYLRRPQAQSHSLSTAADPVASSALDNDDYCVASELLPGVRRPAAPAPARLGPRHGGPLPRKINQCVRKN